MAPASNLLLQVYLEQCCNVLDMLEMLRSDTARLQQLLSGLEFGDSRGLALGWKSVGGPRLVKAASQADVRLMLQLLICSQVIIRGIRHPHMTNLFRRVCSSAYGISKAACSRET